MSARAVSPSPLYDVARSLVALFLYGEATGNRFLVFDGTAPGATEPNGVALPDRPGNLARALCKPLGVDGLLSMLPPEGSGAVRMVIHNADGSRAAACGNGLRVLTALAVARGRGAPGGFAIETDAGPRGAAPLFHALAPCANRDALGRLPRVVGARVSLGKPHWVARDQSLATPAGRVLAQLVDVGNPHCVVAVDDVERAPVAELGAALERHSRFPARTNVEFVERTPEGLSVRIWERGVGETDSCGSGVVAAAFAHRDSREPASSFCITTRGGRLLVRFERGGNAWLEGPASFRPLSADEAEWVDDALTQATEPPE